jgi:hypothetical protein
MTPWRVPKNSTSPLQKFRLFFALAATFFLGAVPVSANPFRSLPEGSDIQDRLMLFCDNSSSPNQAGAPLISNETASTGYSDTAYDESVSSAFDSSNTAFASVLASPYTDIRLENHQNVTLSGAPAETVTLNLRNFVLHDHATLTLAGTATTSFVHQRYEAIFVIGNVEDHFVRQSSME